MPAPAEVGRGAVFSTELCDTGDYNMSCIVCGKPIGMDWWNQGQYIPFLPGMEQFEVHENCFIIAGGGMADSVDNAEKAVKDYVAKGGKGI